MHLNHINIKAPFTALLVEKIFLCDVLDLKEGFRPQFNNRGFWLYTANNPIIHLTESNISEIDKGQGYIDHIAFQKSEIDAFINSLNQLKIEYTINYISEIKSTQIFLKSPLGIKIEVVFTDKSLAQKT